MTRQRSVGPAAVRIGRAIVAATLALGGCGTEPEAISAVGIWDLQTVDGGSLPAVVSDDGTTVIRITRGVLVVQSSGSCLLDATFETTVAGGAPRTESVASTCTWEQNGSSLSFIWSATRQAFGTVDETGLRYTEAGLLYAFVAS